MKANSLACIQVPQQTGGKDWNKNRDQNLTLPWCLYLLDDNNNAISCYLILFFCAFWYSIERGIWNFYELFFTFCY